MGVKAPSQNRVGRPTKLTAARAQEILDLIEAGNFLDTAAACVGVTPSSIRLWMRDGRKAIEESERTGEPIPAKLKARAQFSLDVASARAKAERNLLSTMDEHAAEDWRAAAWRLKMLNRERYGDKQKIEAEVATSVVSVYPALESGTVTTTLTLTEGDIDD